MKKEIVQNAKFFLLKYSEMVADNLFNIKRALEENERIAKNKKRVSDDDTVNEKYHNEILMRISLGEEKIKLREKWLKQLDECIDEFSNYKK